MNLCSHFHCKLAVQHGCCHSRGRPFPCNTNVVRPRYRPQLLRAALVLVVWSHDVSAVRQKVHTSWMSSSAGWGDPSEMKAVGSAQTSTLQLCMHATGSVSQTMHCFPRMTLQHVGMAPLVLQVLREVVFKPVHSGRLLHKPLAPSTPQNACACAVGTEQPCMLTSSGRSRVIVLKVSVAISAQKPSCTSGG